jgi:IS5 family transposase
VVLNKAKRNRPLNFWETVHNRLISRKRFIVERSFGTLKKWYGLARVRYLGFARVQRQVLLNAIAFKKYSPLGNAGAMSCASYAQLIRAVYA